MPRRKVAFVTSGTHVWCRHRESPLPTSMSVHRWPYVCFFVVWSLRITAYRPLSDGGDGELRSLGELELLVNKHLLKFALSRLVAPGAWC